MAFRKQRQARYSKLIKAHFFPFEARALSKLQSNNPFLKELVQTRINTFKQSVKQYEAQGLRFSKAEWKRIIKATYEYESWFEVKKSNKPSPWAMYNDFKRRYRDKYPDWQEQYSKHQRKRKDFMPKLEGMKRARDDQKYPRGRSY